jgi:Serine/threonine protein phosphatase
MITVTGGIILSIIGITLVVCLGLRLSYEPEEEILEIYNLAYSQTTGSKEIQADCVQFHQNAAGILAVIADGIGKENTGKVAAQIAADTVVDAFCSYHILNNPNYFFRTTFLEAHSRIQRTLGERRGGACMGVVFTDGKQLFYGLAGNVQIALFRNGELIPISKGQTLNVLAKEAYKDGLLSKKETIWSMAETRVWNYLGKDGFQEIEIPSLSISLKKQDIVFLASRGLWEELSLVQIEDILLGNQTLQEKAEQLIRSVDTKESQEKENGSVILFMPEVIDEKNQF